MENYCLELKFNVLLFIKFKLLGIKQITPSQKDVLKNLFTKKIDKYTPSITFLTKYQIKKFEKRCLEENIHCSYEIDVNYKYKNDYNKNPFLIYLTKEKAKENIRALKNEKNILLNFQVYILKKFVEKHLIIIINLLMFLQI